MVSLKSVERHFTTNNFNPVLAGKPLYIITNILAQQLISLNSPLTLTLASPSLEFPAQLVAMIEVG